MKRIVPFFCLAAAALGALPLANAQASEPWADSFEIVVNADNPIPALGAKQASNFFLKKVSRWDDGVAVEPIDLALGSTVRAAFTDRVHRRDVRSVLAFWQRQIFSGRSTPPPEAPKGADVLAFVRANRGGIGYVAKGADADGVRRVPVRD